MHPSLFGFTAYHQFILYRLVPNGTSKPDKKPCSYLTGLTHDPHDPAIWTDAATASAVAAAWGDGWGIGFVFSDNDPFFFIDIDKCLIDGKWTQLAVTLCTLFQGCAVEVSASGTGLHIFGVGRPPLHGCKNELLGLEFYHTKRFVALTGISAQGDCCTDMTAVLPALVAQYFAPDASAGGVAAWSDGPVPEWRGPADDAELIRRAMRPTANSAFSGKAGFGDLWTANETALAASYPDPKRAYDASSADAALAQHLAFWTGKDCARIERLMRQSALVRDKWDSHTTYMERTITGAVARQEAVLGDKEPAVTVSAPVVDGVTGVEAPSDRGGNGYMDDLLNHFKGCVYIESQHRALTPDGLLLKPDAFGIRYGGFTFRMDASNEKVTDEAWKAWTQHKVKTCVRAFSTCFRPDLPHGAIVTRNGQRFANTYIPLNIERTPGDVSPFLNHLKKLLPDERDAAIFLSYMAALVQHQGTKFQWAPLLQGVEGNGKSFFSYAVEGAVGARYTHWPKAKKIAKDFNAWMTGKVFYAVEDIYVPDSKREVMEDLKPMITGRSMEIEQKGVDQVTADICGNFIFNTNHKDGIIKSDKDRRFCMLFTAQQSIDDLERDGMGQNSPYMTGIYKWLQREGGQAIVNEFLYTYPIADELNPARDCQRAPFTTSSLEAISASKGNIEQEIEEAIEQGLHGFCGGWISSLMFDRYLEALGMGTARISRGKRKQILDQMGYIQHPHLKDGRVNNLVTPDNGKPRLYIHKTNQMLAQIVNPATISKAYENANRVLVSNPFTQRA